MIFSIIFIFTYAINYVKDLHLKVAPYTYQNLPNWEMN